MLTKPCKCCGKQIPVSSREWICHDCKMKPSAPNYCGRGIIDPMLIQDAMYEGFTAVEACGGDWWAVDLWV